MLSLFSGCKRASEVRTLGFKDILAADVDAAKHGQRVRNIGTVTYSDPEWHLLFLQDQDWGVYLQPPPDSNFKAGDRLEITGTTTVPSKVLDRTEFSVWRRGDRTPTPIALESASRFPSFPSRFVETTGTVRWAGIRNGRASLEVFAGDREFQAVVFPGTSEDLPFIGSKIQIAGVSAPAYDKNGQIQSLQLLTPSALYIRILKPGAKDAFSLPIRHLAELKDVPVGNLVRVSGQVLDTLGHRSITEGKFSAEIHLHDRSPGDFPAADVVGFWSGDSIDDAMIRATDEHSAVRGDVIRLSDLKQMTVAEAAKRRRVSVRAVVTYWDPYWHLLFVADKTDGAFVVPAQFNFRLRPGDVVNVSGVSSPGDYAPIIAEAKVSFVGRGKLPIPLKLDLLEGNLVAADSQWCTVQGIVHTAQVLDGHTILKLGGGSTALNVQLPTIIRGEQLVDRELVVTGVLGSEFNERRQTVGHQMFVPAREFLQMVATGERANRPSTIASLRRYVPHFDEHHRVQLKGTVVLKTTDNVFFIEDQSAGIEVRAFGPVKVSDGDRVSVRGFVVGGEYSPVLEDAQVELDARGDMLQAGQVSPKAALEGQYDSEYVSVSGTLVAIRSAPSGVTLVLNDQGIFFDAVGPAASELASLRLGSRLVVRGICQVILDRTKIPVPIQGFTLAFDAPRRVSVIQPGPWWDTDKISWALFLIALIAAGASLWAALLRRQVGIKTKELRVSLEATRKANQFDTARNRVLETIASNAPPSDSLEQLVLAIEEHISGSLCIIAVPDARKGPLIARSSPLIVGPGIPEQLQAEMLPLLRSLAGATSEGVPARGASSESDMLQKLLGRLRAAGLDFKDGIIKIAIAGNGSEAGVLILLFKNPLAATDSATQSIVQSASRLVCVACDHWLMHERLLHQAHHDRLTGLPNRSFAEDRLEQALARAERHRQVFAIFCIDLDGFKTINDQLGHVAGDELLCAVSPRLRSRIRLSDTVARVGGDEFIAIVEDLSGELAAQSVAEALLTALEEPILLEGGRQTVSASIGIAMYPVDGTTTAELERHADQAMYRAKRRGGRQVCFWSREGQDVARTCP